MRKRTHDEPNKATGKPRGRVERALVKTEETVARRTRGRCSLFCGDSACDKGCAG